MAMDSAEISLRSENKSEMISSNVSNKNLSVSTSLTLNRNSSIVENESSGVSTTRSVNSPISLVAESIPSLGTECASNSTAKINSPKQSNNSSNFTVDNLIRTELTVHEQHSHQCSEANVSYVGDRDDHMDSNSEVKRYTDINDVNVDLSNSGVILPTEQMQPLDHEAESLSSDINVRCSISGQGKTDTTNSLPVTESNICGTTLVINTAPSPSSSVVLSPTSGNLVTSWSLHNILTSSSHTTEPENQSKSRVQSTSIPDPLLLHSPEKSIEQAVNAALCSLERDMENTEGEEEDSSADEVTKEAEETICIKENELEKVEKINASHAAKHFHCQEDEESREVVKGKQHKREKVDFDPDNIEYTHKPLARTKKPYKQTTEKRKIKNYWFREFPWLVYDEVKSLFFCSYCTAVKCDNIFTRGRPAVKPRKDYMVKHEATNPHKTAMSRLKIIPDVLDESEGKSEESKKSKNPSAVRRMKQFLYEKIPDEIDASTAHLLKFIPSEQSGPENRIIHERWFLEFTWFVYNHKQERFFCKLCREAGVKGVYTHGKPATNPKKGDLQVHERTSQHVSVLRRLGLPIPIKKENVRCKPAGSVADKLQESVAPEKDDVHSITGKLSDSKHNNQTDTDSVEGCKDKPNVEIVSTENSDDEEQTQRTCNKEEKSRTRRHIKSWWFLDFPWLKYNKEDECFYCEQCRKYNQPGVFSTGKKATVPKKDNFVKHEDTESHHIALLQEAGLSKEEAMEQIINGFGNDSRKKLSMVMTTNSDEEMEMMGYMSSGRVDSQGMYITSDQGHDHQVESHLDTEPQTNQMHNEQATSLDCNSGHFAREEDPALDILTSLSVGDRVPESVVAAASSDRRGQFHNIRMEWFVEFVWLELEEILLKLYCRYCKYFDPCGVFSVGKIAAHTRYLDIKKHNSSESHRRCLQMHAEQYPDTIQRIQQDETSNGYDHENLTKITPRHWSILFPWMQHDKATDALFCQPCQQDGMSGSLVSGIERSKINISEIEDHEQLVSHRTAVVQHKRRHLATLTTPTTSLVSQETERVLGKHTKTKRKRGRPKKYPASRKDVDISEITSKAMPQSSPSATNYEGWTEAFWNMASRLRHLGILCDVTLSVGTNPNDIKIFQAHKLVLVCASEFFKACLRENNFEQYYHFSNISVEGMEGILSFMYGEHHKIEPKHYKDVYEAASIFAIPFATAFYRELVIDQDNGSRQINADNDDSKFENAPNENRKGKGNEFDDGKSVINDDGGVKSNEQLNSTENAETNKERAESGDFTDDTITMSQQTKTSTAHRNRKTRESCTLSYKSVISSDIHQQAIEDRKRLLTRTLPTCNVCGRRFLRIGFLRRHKERKHFRNRDKRVYKCEFCPKVCRTSKDIKLHKRRHTGERPFLCNQCGKAFTRRETLMEHAYVHKPDSDKPHKCTECGKGFFKLFDLQRHFTGIHSGLKPFQCHLCGKSFAWSRSLQDHLAGHVGKSRPFTCELCDMKFVRKYDLQRHQVKHEAKKPFRCNWCGRFFTQKSSMDKHQRDYCRSKPDKKKASSLSTNLEPTSVVPQQIQLPQHYDQPVNLTAGVKDMSMTSVELGHTHNTDSSDMASSVPQHNSTQQGLNGYDSFQINSNLLPQNHVNVYPTPANIVGPASGDVYHNQSMWMLGQTLDPASAILFHHNQVSQ